VNSTCAALAPLARDHQLIITHGNGPPVGVPALQSAADRALRPGGFIDGDVDLLLGGSEGSLSTSISGNSRRE
jgi:carbamate kinase